MTATAISTTPDYDAIVRTVQLYIDGFNDGDIAKFQAAFYEDAWIFFTDAAGTLHKDRLSNCFEEWAAGAQAGPVHIVGRVLSVTQAGDVASVLLGFDNLIDRSSCWVDTHALLRIDGVWKIMNKTATHRSRAGGAS